MLYSFFQIPRASVITVPQRYTLNEYQDVQISFSEVVAWWRVVQSRGTVVFIRLKISDDAFGVDDGLFVALDGTWTEALEDSTAPPGGGGGGGDIRVAAGGFYGLFEPALSVSFPAANTFVELNQANLVGLNPYAQAGSSNVTYDVVNNRLRLDWAAPVPTTDSWLQGMAVLTLAATNNNQTYAVAFGVNGVVEPQFQVQFIRENPGDSETVTLHGHRQVPNGTELSIFIANLTSTSPVEISNVNFRFFGNNDVS